MNNSKLGIPQINMLSQKQIEQIVEAIYEVLESQGSIVSHPEARKLLLEAGATETDDGKRMLIPRKLVQDAINSAPKRILMYDRDGNMNMDLGDDRSYFGIIADAMDIIDPITAERRPCRSTDWANWAKVVDYLPNMEFMHLCGCADDISAEQAYRKIGYETFLNTRKTIGLAMGSVESVEEIIGVAEIIAGGPEKFKEKPNVFVISEPVTPLEHPEDSLARLLLAAEKRAPLAYYGMQMQCVTTPATGAGAIIISLAEALTGLVIHQLKSPGAPFLLGGEPATMDMKSTVFSYGAPEMNRNLIGEMEVAHYLGIPTWGTACTDSKKYDAQCGMEFGVSILIAMMTGQNLVHDPGLIDQGLVASLQTAVLNDEMIRWCRKIMTGISTADEELALDIMADVGAGGNYLMHKHSLKKSKELWKPWMFDRSADYRNVEPIETRLENEVRRILETHEVPSLPDDILARIEAHRKEWDEKSSAK